MAKRKDKENQDNENLNDNNGEGNFGLPDIEYKPLETQEEKNPESESSFTAPQEEPVAYQESTYTYRPTPEDTSSKAPIVISLLIAVVVLVGGFLVYQYWYVPKAEKEKKELADAKIAAKAKADAAAAEAKLRLAEEQRQKEIADSIAAANVKPAIGTIESLGSRTRLYYVVIASAVDGDLIMDYAKRLSKKGVSTKIIPPFGKWKFYRLTINEFDTYEAAQTNADSAKPEFGEGAWVIRY